MGAGELLVRAALLTEAAQDSRRDARGIAGAAGARRGRRDKARTARAGLARWGGEEACGWQFFSSGCSMFTPSPAATGNPRSIRRRSAGVGARTGASRCPRGRRPGWRAAGQQTCGRQSLAYRPPLAQLGAGRLGLVGRRHAWAEFLRAPAAAWGIATRPGGLPGAQHPAPAPQQPDYRRDAVQRAAAPVRRAQGRRK